MDTSIMRMAGLAAVVATLPVASAAEELRIGTAGLGGAFFPVGQTISNLVNRHADGLTMVPIVTGGAVENPRLLVSGEIDMGISNSNVAYYAYSGAAPFSEALDIRSLGPLHFSAMHIATLAGSDITSIPDLRGRRVALGPAGGGAANFMQSLLEVHGMEMTDIQPTFVSFADGFSQLTDGNVDVAIASAGFPTAAVTQALATNQLSFIQVDDERLAALFEAHPYYSLFTAPAGIYGNADPIDMPGVVNVLVVSTDMDEDRAHALAEAIYGNLDEFIAENALGNDIDPSLALDLAVPLHPGARRHFEARD